jgi:MscS family membrane protein
VETFAHILETVQETFLTVQEDLLLRIMDIVESGGSGFAFPSQTLYMTKDGDLKGREEAEAMKRFKSKS